LIFFIITFLNNQESKLQTPDEQVEQEFLFAEFFFIKNSPSQTLFNFFDLHLGQTTFFPSD